MDKLEWDSKFWNIDIFNMNQEYNFLALNKLNKEKHSPFLIQSLIDINEVEIINQLEDRGFRYIETKINFKKKVKEVVEINEENYKCVLYKDIKRYKNIFGQLYYEFSRYNIFEFKKVNEFYYTWVVNSIEGKMDDKCIGYYINGDLSGFITYRIRNNKLIIGLIGVFPDFQNRGIGQKLLDKVTNETFENNYNIINISTQGTNYNAINAYIKNGFVVKDIKNWYYLIKGR